MENLQAELAQARQESTKQAEKIAAYKTHRQQLHRELRRTQTFKEQSKQETYSLQEKLQELSSLVQHWQQLHLDSEQILALREEKLVVFKVEPSFLKEELSKLLQSNNLTAPALHDSAELLPPGGRATRATSSRTRSSTKQSKD
ncbi:polyamine-modulated factor 1-binding protein 1 isoform X2 [Agelaius phoeniceus]|uniref:polyamine-modulated factor 1-binding protein 1 isoform X2 n=1 Tax=Agelaius phoeniceus TaxID=39638 RepID=UPI004054BF7B